MARIDVSVTAPVDAPAATVYGILTDYRKAHPRILPRPNFGDLVVEEGGRGAGTLFRVDIKEGPRMRTLRMRATEPEPGRVLVESDVESDMVTTFTVDPRDGGKRCEVTIATAWTRGGVRGMVERLAAPRLMRPVYLQEIRNLEALARRMAGRGNR
ncbi:SRPBCC family protein [Longimicrobium terrae]|uniref:SRPBCC family protein n=1 Tax=Longimicrobium terrae TaxID=1639882 RepID=A0A841GZH0_9BACT|nr:SRPBCC family protein [Longimicrobium terrae]MBB4636853.1 hypothetical protein [Longimicrobium terrae]MBB6071147.1 hypothetical protein [Longimicrobium terrae]NNC29196.1 SRPBCC family protein [Longimicrobium terrae]